MDDYTYPLETYRRGETKVYMSRSSKRRVSFPSYEGRPDLLSSREIVASIEGLTYRMLDYWTRRGYVELLDEETVDAQGSGTRRFYSVDMIPKLKMVIALANRLRPSHLEKIFVAVKEAQRVRSGYMVKVDRLTIIIDEEDIDDSFY